MKKKIQAYLFDVDGTLIDSNDAHTRAWQDGLAAAKIEVPLSDIRKKIGKGGDKLLPELTGIAIDSPQGKAISDNVGKIFLEKYLPTIEAFPHTRELFLALQALGLKTVIATSSDKEKLGKLLQIAQVADLLDAASSADDAEDSKPDPDILHAAMKKVGVTPAHCVMVGDTPYDLQAAHKAHVAAIAVRCGGFWQDADFRYAQRIFDGPAALLAAVKLTPQRFVDGDF